MRRLFSQHRRASVVVAFLVLGLAAVAAVGTDLPSVDAPCTPCIPILKEYEEISVPLTGTPSTSPCIPPGTYVKGNMRIRTSFVATTCGTWARQEISSCGRICVPGVGEFTSSERHVNETKVSATGAVEYTILDSYRHTLGGCRESYRMYVKIMVKINPTGEIIAHCEDIDIDCYAL